MASRVTPYLNPYLECICYNFNQCNAQFLLVLIVAALLLSLQKLEVFLTAFFGFLVTKYKFT